MSVVRSLSTDALTMSAPRPAAGPTLAFLEFFLRPANAPSSGRLLLGILDPADELVAGERRDVVPSLKCCLVSDQRRAKVCGKLVYRPTGNPLAAHRVKVAVVGADVSAVQRSFLARSTSAGRLRLKP